MILSRAPKQCNFVEWRGHKVVYKRYSDGETSSFVIYCNSFSRHPLLFVVVIELSLYKCISDAGMLVSISACALIKMTMN